jgi:hypothetical protein
MKMNALYDGVVDPNLSARNVRFGSYGLEFWHVALLRRIPLVLFRSKSIVVDRGRADNALEIQESELCIANPVRSACPLSKQAFNRALASSAQGPFPSGWPVNVLPG